MSLGDDFCQYCTARRDNNLWWGGDDGALCVCVCRRGGGGGGGGGGLGLFDNVRLHVCTSALHLAKHPAGMSNNKWVHS